MLQLFYAKNRSMKHLIFESRVHWPTWRSSFKIFLFEWKWILIGGDMVERSTFWEKKEAVMMNKNYNDTKLLS